jgi:hypothetical protein
MQPFDIKSLYTIVFSAAAYFICYALFKNLEGIGWIFVRSFLFIALFASAAFMTKLSPDLVPVLQTVRKKLRF